MKMFAAYTRSYFFILSIRATVLTGFLTLTAGFQQTGRAADYALSFANATQIVNTSARITTANFTVEA